MHRAEAELAGIESELRQTRRDIVSLQNNLEPGPALGRVRAGRLQIEAFAREQHRVQLGCFEEREKALVKQCENAADHVDEAKEKVIKAHKARHLLSG